MATPANRTTRDSSKEFTMKFVEKWPTETGVDWWDQCRRELNVIIEAYNQWQIDGMPNHGKQHVLNLIEYGKQTLGSKDGGRGYLRQLIEMQAFVESKSQDETTR